VDTELSPGTGVPSWVPFPAEPKAFFYAIPLLVSDPGVKQRKLSQRVTFSMGHAGANKSALMAHPGKYSVKDSVGQFLPTP